MNPTAPDGLPPANGLPEAVNAMLLALDMTWGGRELTVNAMAVVIREWLAGDVPSREALADMLSVLETDLHTAARVRSCVQDVLLSGDLDRLKGAL